MMPRNSVGTQAGRRRPGRRYAIGLWLFFVALALPTDARASLLSPELEDKLATFLALFVIFVVPVVLIALFWMVHILPEKIAHKRHHPQFEAIRTLCLLSLVFGGLLWPIAWLWAYSKPVMHKMAYGTDKLRSRETTATRRDEAAQGEPARAAGAPRGTRHPATELTDAFAPISRRSRPSSRERRSEVARWKSSSSASIRSSSG